MIKVVLGDSKDSKTVGKVFITQEDKVLLLKRPGWMPHPNKWDLPGGHIHVGEPILSGTVREVREETQLILDPNNLNSVYKVKNQNFFHTETYTGRVNISFEHTEYVWADIDRLFTYDAGEMYNKVFTAFSKLHGSK